MSTRLTDEQRLAIRERAEKATPEPWAWDNRGEKCDDIQVGVAFGPEEDAQPILGYFDNEDAVYAEGVACSVNYQYDADFIAHARTDIPALLDHCTALEAELQEARAQAKQFDEALQTCIEASAKPR